MFTYADPRIQNSNRIRIVSDRPRLGQPIVSSRVVEISRRFRPPFFFRLTTRLQEKSRRWNRSNGFRNDW